MHSSRRTWRVRGVPLDIGQNTLAQVLRHHPDLRPDEDTPENGENCGNGVIVHTLAPDLEFYEQAATVRFHNLPSQLHTLETRSQLAIVASIPQGDPLGPPAGDTRFARITIDEHFDGMTVLISPSTDDEHQIDVLAVSGLGSHPFGSFVHKEDGNMWLSDRLPQKLPTARVMIYGYASGLQHSDSFVQLHDLAGQLRSDLSQLLGSNKRKPLLLIGHSLGGLLIKEAMIQIAESDSESNLNMILGIFLFGAPNDGMDIESLIPMVNDQPNRFLLESLNAMNSQILWLQRREFSKVLNRTKCQLFCFYETERSPTAAKDPRTGRYEMSGPRRCLVSPPSATSCLPAGVSPDHSIAIRRTHSDLVKFAYHDSEYDRVAHILGGIQQMSTRHRINEEEVQLEKPSKRPVDEILLPRKRLRTAGQLSETQQPQTVCDSTLHEPPSHAEMKDLKQSLISQLYFSKIDERLTNLTPAQGTTCRWFLTKPEYLSWHDVAQQPDHGGFLWIKGNPGTGKSTLMKFLFETAKVNAKGHPSQITLSFFFLARGTVEEKTTAGLYRSLLHQLFEKASDLQDSLEWMTADGARVSQRNGWREEALKQTLMHAVRKLGNRSLTIFVDALDECDKDQAAGMVFFFEELCDRATEANIRLQICFSSRHYPTVIVQKGIEITLEDEPGHDQDIQKFIKRRLRLGKTKKAELLRSEILQKSSGIFLWVVLVVDILNSEYPDKSISSNKIRARLREIPPELNDLFKMILSRDGENLERLQLCLNWILFAARPLKPQELYFAIEFGFDKECSGFWDQDDVDLENIKTFVRSSSKGLAEVTRKASEVQFIHESVRDFLRGEYESQWSENSSNFVGHGHKLLRDCCFAQLNASISQEVDIPDVLPRASESAQLRDTITSKFPFLEYSVLNVLHHTNGAQQNGIEQGHLLAGFPLQRWISLNNALERYDIRRYTKSVSLLYILAEKNLADLIRIHSRRQFCFDVEAERYGAPIIAALATSSHEAICALLKAQAETESPTSPLHSLFEQYYQKRNKPTGFGRNFVFSRRKGLFVHLIEQCDDAVASAFLSSHKFDINFRNNAVQTLSMAAARGQETVINLLLEKGADIESRDNNGNTALLLAAAHGQEIIINLLLEKGVDIESRDNNGHTALLLAAAYGQETVINLLLEKGADIESRDNNGQTALLLATVYEQKTSINLLLEKGADIDLEDNNGNTALLLAATHKQKIIINLLLKKKADIELRDNNS